MLIKKFPAPSRIDYVASPYEPNEDGVMDVGYYNGALSDGRAYRLECWRMDEMLMMTVMFCIKRKEEMLLSSNSSYFFPSCSSSIIRMQETKVPFWRWFIMQSQHLP